MNKFFKPRNILLWMLGAAFLVLSACATTQPAGKVIEERAMARWDALLRDDLADAYAYLSPGYRSSISLKQYQRSLLLMRLRWDEVKYIESDCTESVCKVKISLKYTVFGAVPGVRSFDGTQTIEESWVRTDGEWYLVPEK